jgi:hypothetical protein
MLHANKLRFVILAVSPDGVVTMLGKMRKTKKNDHALPLARPTVVLTDYRRRGRAALFFFASASFSSIHVGA